MLLCLSSLFGKYAGRPVPVIPTVLCELSDVVLGKEGKRQVILRNSLRRKVSVTRLFSHCKIDVPEVEENYNTGIKLTGGNRYAVLVDGRNYATITDEAKKHSAQPKMAVNLIAQAIVITSLASRLIANFLIKFYKQNNNVDMKLFTDYDAALNWVKEKVKENKLIPADKDEQ